MIPVLTCQFAACDRATHNVSDVNCRPGGLPDTHLAHREPHALAAGDEAEAAMGFTNDLRERGQRALDVRSGATLFSSERLQGQTPGRFSHSLSSLVSYGNGAKIDRSKEKHRGKGRNPRQVVLGRLQPPVLLAPALHRWRLLSGLCGLWG